MTRTTPRQSRIIVAALVASLLVVIGGFLGVVGYAFSEGRSMCRLAFTRAVVQAIRTYAEDYNGALPPAIVLSDPAFTSHPLCESYLLPESYGNPDLCCSSKPIRLALVRPAETIDEITDPPSTIGALDILAVHANHRRIAICAFDVKPRYVTRDEFDALRRHPANHALAEVLAEPVPNTPKGQR